MPRFLSCLLILASFILLTLSSLIFLEAPKIWIWKATILATEYGHRIAIVAILGAFFSYRESKIAFSLFLISTVLLNIPLFTCRSMQEPLKAQMQQVFHLEMPVNPSTMLNPTKLYWGRSIQEKIPHTFTYATHGGIALDVDFVAARLTRNAPCILAIHGGGWNSGNRTQLSPLNTWLSERGFAVASIDYRLAPQSKWPAPREDAMAAIAYLKQNSSQLGIDPTQIILLGRSAGGQIAEQIAYSAHDPAIRGVVAYYSPADLNFAYKYSSPDDILDSSQLLKDYVGGSPQENPKKYNDASAIQFVSKDSPPTLLFHGARDELVWIKQSERLSKVLNDYKVPHVFVRYRFTTHGFDYNLNGPSGLISLYALEHFLRAVTR